MVAHFHYVLSVATVFAIYAGIYYWIGKMSGRQYSEIAGRWQFWITFVGANVLFFPQHFLGMAGMPRRIPDYPDAYAGWNMVSSIGAVITMVGAFLFLWILFRTLTAGAPAKDNPWGEGATTLEWTVPSPAPFHTHEELPDMGDPKAAE